MAQIVIDVRSPSEYAAGHLQGAVNLDLRSPGFHDSVGLLSRTDSYVVYCGGGRRAGQAREAMQSLGFADVTSGSILRAQAATGLPVVEDD